MKKSNIEKPTTALLDLLNRNVAPPESNTSYTSLQKKDVKTSLQESLTAVKVQKNTTILGADFSTPKHSKDPPTNKLEESRPKWS